ncbi:MAG: 50S ribosomal protein L9 [Candidatus Neomarinimicrobiota bacterium]|mgnify:FL=1|nr:MAG: 50S ribosomal protein L9 [Candidatus Neomarinimicrobiota bacterium]|tara:strand:- start:132 stop:581 length:450 start_codon:yes stop_codon:yes gene_type:complete
MKVILTKDIEGLGNEGDIIIVKPGFARNFLLPKGLAVNFSSNQLTKIENELKQQERKIEREKDGLSQILNQLSSLEVSIKAKSEDNEKLFGSVTKADIEQLLLQNNIKIDKKYIDLKSPIKTLGLHEIDVKFNSELSGSFKVNIEKEED